MYGTPVLVHQDTVAELKKKYHAKAPKYYPARQRLTLPAKEGQKSGDVLQDRDQLSKYGLTNGSVVLFKDLGTQVSPGPAVRPKPGCLQFTTPAAELCRQQTTQHQSRVLALLVLTAPCSARTGVVASTPQTSQQLSLASGL